MKDKIFKYIFFTVSIVIIIGACVFVFVNKENNKKEVEKEDRKISISKEYTIGICGFDTINPVKTKSLDMQYLSKLIFRSLLKVTKDFKIENDIAKECSKIDDKTYILKLKDDVKLHNGDVLNSEDVKFTIDNLKETNSVYFENVKHIENVEVLDNYTVKIFLDEEIDFFEYLLTFPILSKNCYEEKTLESKFEIPIGTGDFKIVEINDDSFLLESRDTKINVKVYDDMSNCYLDLEKEKINLLNTENIDYEKYTGKLGVNYNISSGREFDYIAINNKNNLLRNDEVRKALNFFIDRKKIIYEVFNNKYIASCFPLNVECYLYKEEGDMYDVNKGKDVLIENGWQFKNKVWQKNGVRLQLYLLVNINDKTRCKIAKLIKESLEENGIRIKIIEANNYYFEQKLKNGNYDLALTGSILPIYPSVSSYFDENNIFNYTNEEITSILKDIKNIKDEELLKEKYYRIQEIYIEDMPFISLYLNVNYILYNSKIKGDFTHNWYDLYYNANNWYIEN